MSHTRREFFAASAVVATGLRARPARAASCEPRPGCVRFATGRRIAFSELGNPTGSVVVIYQHGLPSSRREAEVLLPALPAFPNVRLIALDRPGIGGSDPVACPSFLDWANDLAACADALGVDRFALTGTSGGTPYTFAAALAMPKRVTRIALACPVAEHRRGRDNGAITWFQTLAHTRPRVANRLVSTGTRLVARKHERIAKLLPLTPAERRLLDDPKNLELIAGIMLDSMEGGAQGAVAEAALLPGPWGLPLCKVAVPTVFLHGTADRIAPPWMPESLARQIPGAEVRLYPGEGHLSMPHNHAADILAAAVG